ncbi:hypothetical protein [Nocardioides soli]|uniref:Uncharacterized protein n=1 Tax=Nocardioides soli TaxID=1036020 RepID=A0A7W4VZZ5_9ACTN|nr:hypothetical protein [Nocardioides soli]MBB3044903.1 hypothetical protein [Nocardioides soli]
MSAEWANVIVSGIALCAAIAAGVAAVSSLHVEQRRDALYDEDRRAQQAALIAAWVRDQSTGTWEAVARNGSSVPVYDVTVFYRSEGSPEMHQTMSLPILPPGDTPLPYPDGWNWTTGNDVAHMIDDVRLAVSFRDAQSLYWLRDESGILSFHPDFRKSQLHRLRLEAWMRRPKRRRIFRTPPSLSDLN